jgi:hypothetical protein
MEGFTGQEPKAFNRLSTMGYLACHTHHNSFNPNCNRRGEFAPLRSLVRLRFSPKLNTSSDNLFRLFERHVSGVKLFFTVPSGAVEISGFERVVGE